ncbi:MAG TPA: DUF2807 domain-containing protein [Rhizomicrobium sp.]|jgi:hypothetical protein|nr:DUF2807 domain-containing protein [Rhizomicrobium sp.]
MTLLRLAPVAALFGCLAAPALAATAVPVEHFDGVGLEGGGHVVIKHGAQQRVTLIDGSAQHTKIRVEHGSLKIDACNQDCPHEYKLNIEIVTPELSAAAIEGGGHIVAESGFPSQRELSAAVEGGGHLDLSAIAADKVSAAVDGGGHIQVRAGKSLSAAVNGGGSIVYEGDPEVASAIDGGGSVSKAAK